MLVYPSTLKKESLVIDNFALKRDLNAANQMSLDDQTKAVTIAAKLLNEDDYILKLLLRYLLSHPCVWSGVGQGQEQV